MYGIQGIRLILSLNPETFEQWFSVCRIAASPVAERRVNCTGGYAMSLSNCYSLVTRVLVLLALGVGLSGAASAAGTLAFSASGYSAQQTAGNVTFTVKRTSSAKGAVTVQYATVNGSGVAGRDYTAKAGTLRWNDGDSSAKTVSVPISKATPFMGTKTFKLRMTGVKGASLGSPNIATATIQGTGSKISLATGTYSAQQTAGSVTITVNRSGSSGAASVRYQTKDGTALAGKHYSAKSGTLNWAAGDASSKKVVVPLSSSAFTGSKSFQFVLSKTSGASVGTWNANVTVVGAGSSGGGGTPGGTPDDPPPPSDPGTCERNSQSWVTTGIFDSKRFGNYVVNNNNWGGTPNQQLWANNESCWGVTTTATAERYSIGSYPSVTRGWSQNATIMQQLSSPGTNDWTTKSGMGIPVGQLTKAKVRWAFTAPSAPSSRWLGLIDVYFHRSNKPSPTEFPPVVDLMIDQALADQPVNSTTYYALVAGNANATTVTLGGVTYLVYIDEPGEAIYHQSGGHTIHLFATPTDVTHKNGPNWGTRNGTTDVAAIVKYFMQSNPKDDAGRPLRTASGATVTSPLIASNLYLNAINAGWEIDFGTQFKNSKFCVAMQGEPDC